MVLVRPQYTRRCSEDGQTTQGQVTACRAQCAGVGAGKAAQRQQTRHIAQVGVCFADPHKLIDLLQMGVVPARISGAGRHDLATVRRFVFGYRPPPFCPFSHASEEAAVRPIPSPRLLNPVQIRRNAAVIFL